MVLTSDLDALVIELQDPRNLQQAQVWYEIGNATTRRRYHIREAMVIAMRRLIDQAIREGLISDSPGGQTFSSKARSVPSDGQTAATLSTIELVW